MPKTISFREMSKTGWTTTFEDGQSEWPGYERINTGSLQRIADATELMAKGYVEMQNEIDRLKRMLTDRSKTIEYYQDTNKALRFSIAGYKAHLTRLRNKIAGETL